MVSFCSLNIIPQQNMGTSSTYKLKFAQQKHRANFVLVRIRRIGVKSLSSLFVLSDSNSLSASSPGSASTLSLRYRVASQPPLFDSPYSAKIYFANAPHLLRYFCADRENRTPVLSLATICSTTKLYPQVRSGIWMNKRCNLLFGHIPSERRGYMLVSYIRK